MSVRIMRSAMIGCLLALFVSTVAAVDLPAGVAGIERALAGRSWMASRDQWPCVYSGRFEQKRRVEGVRREIVSSGSFWQDCSRGLVWLVATPSPEALVYTRSGNHLSFRRADRLRALDGPVERRVASLLLALFAGDAAALAKDFRLGEIDAARDIASIVPLDERFARRLESIELGGTEDTARIALAGDATGAMSLVLTDFAANDVDSFDACVATFGDAVRVASLAAAACDALRRPGRYLTPVRSDSAG